MHSCTAFSNASSKQKNGPFISRLGLLAIRVQYAGYVGCILCFIGWLAKYINFCGIRTGRVSPQIASAQRSKKDSMPTDSDFFKSDLASYTETLSCFFYSPLQNTQEISLDYYLAYFLLYQTYEMNKETGCYTSDDRYFLKIPEQDLLQTAELYLGLSNFSISDISAWPFAAPENGICYFTQETSLPYSDTSITNITVDKETGKILVFADLYDSQYEDSTQEKTSLIYHFSVISAANGKTVYRLESVTV